MDSTVVETSSSVTKCPWAKPVRTAADDGKNTSPWGSPAAAPFPCSLEEVMNEEVAKELQAEEEKKAALRLSEEEVDLCQYLGAASADDTDTSNDILLAQMLQHEFNREYDAELKAKEEKFNGDSKVTLSFTNYRSVHPALDSDDSEDEVHEWQTEDPKNAPPNFKKGTGICGKGKNIVTKHDATITGRKNASRVMERFPLDVNTGDAASIDMKLPNHVYNKLKTHSMVEHKKAQRIHEKKEHSTAEHAMDPKTRLILYKLINSEALMSVNGVVSVGKESVVFHADGGHMRDRTVPTECAIKVYKTTLNEFKNRGEYVQGDFRLGKTDVFKKQNPRKIMRLWAEKEEANLRLMERHCLPCPRVVTVRKNILVMSFLGQNQQASPKLKDARLSKAEMEIAYDQCITNMKRLYTDCSLVHADLSEYNMLWHNNMVHFIDVSQSVDKIHPRALHFLLRDCTNVSNFFTKMGVHEVKNPYELFKSVTGLDFQCDENKGQADFLAQIQDYEKNEDRLRQGQGKEYAFEYFFNMATEERKAAKKAERLQAELESSEDDSQDEEDEVPHGIAETQILKSISSEANQKAASSSGETSNPLGLP